MNDGSTELAETLFSERVYELFALWEEALEEGRPFDLSGIEPELRAQLQTLIDRLNPTSTKTETLPERPPETPRYQFVEFIAQGGMGEVWRGNDKRLERDVALKVVRSPWRISQQAFWAESRLVAGLTHPGIAAVYDLDQLQDGRPFFAMKFVEGQTFEEFLKNSTDRAATTESLRIFRQICETMAYAHGQTPQLIHRDLKPQNVMVGIYGETFVMDWGLAKTLVPRPRSDDCVQSDVVANSGAAATDHAARSTMTGMVKGTIAYMSPEQARGEVNRIGPATDVFALGGILCRILTGAPTFCGEGRLAAAARGDVSEAYLRLDASGADAKLISIAKACLAPDIEDRYAHAGEVLAAISSYEHQQRERLRKVEIEDARRAVKALLVKATVATALIGLVILAVFTLLLAAANRAERKARAEAERHATAETAAKEEAQAAEKMANKEQTRSEWLLYATQLIMAQRELENKNAAQAIATLNSCQWNLRGWDHGHVRHLVENGQPPLAIAAGPDRIWGIAFSQDGKRIATAGDDGIVRVWEAGTGAEFAALKGHPDQVTSVAFSPDGKRLISGGGKLGAPAEVKVWDLQTKKEAFSLPGHSQEIWCVCYSPNGKQIATASGDKTVKVWDAAGGRDARSFVGHSDRVSSVAFNSDGTQIATGSWDKTIKVWNVQTSEEIRTLKGHNYMVWSGLQPQSRNARIARQRRRGPIEGR